ncbi:MAG: lipopolysaccharide transport periplasmic protein LptA [Burkholderiales bacterium]
MPFNRNRILLLVPLILMGGQAVAEKADRTKPVDLSADKAEYDGLNKTGLYEGNVLLTQGTIRIQADKVVVKSDKRGTTFATATGSPVSFRQKLDGSEDFIEGYGERLDFDTKSDTVQLIDRAFIKRGQDELRGNYISYNSRTEVFRVDGRSSSTGSAAPTGSGRVHVIIQPKNSEPDDASAAPAPKQ